MTEEDELLWDSIPRGHRSEIIKSALNDWKMKATSKKYNIELLTKLEHLQKRRLELEKEYSKAEMEFNEIKGLKHQTPNIKRLFKNLHQRLEN